ncbi:MAG: hypothetical protein WBE56_00120, partial [Terracidiphilus sp.]
MDVRIIIVHNRYRASVDKGESYREDHQNRLVPVVGLIWSDPVNPAESMGLFLSLSLFLLFPEDRASSSLGRFERR